MKYQENNKTLIKSITFQVKVMFVKRFPGINYTTLAITGAYHLLMHYGLATFHKKGLMISSLD